MIDKAPEFAIPTPEIYFVFYDSEIKTFYEYNPQYLLVPYEEIQKKNLSRHEIFTKAIQIIKKGQKASEIEAIYLQSIISYDKALKSASRADAFMNYWRILEFQSNQKKQKNNEIVNNFSKLYKEDELKAIAKLITIERNTFVHLGTHDDYSDNYANWAKEYAEQALRTLLYLIYKGYKNKSDITYFYLNCSLNKSELKKRIKFLKILVKDQSG